MLTLMVIFTGYANLDAVHRGGINKGFANTQPLHPSTEYQQYAMYDAGTQKNNTGLGQYNISAHTATFQANTEKMKATVNVSNVIADNAQSMDQYIQQGYKFLGTSITSSGSGQVNLYALPANIIISQN